MLLQQCVGVSILYQVDYGISREFLLLPLTDRFDVMITVYL